MTPQPRQRSGGDIYASAEIERLAQSKTTSADAFADEFVRLAPDVPQMATDHETMLAWFAVAIEAGRAEHRQALERIVREAELAPMEDGLDAGGIAREALRDV